METLEVSVHVQPGSLRERVLVLSQVCWEATGASYNGARESDLHLIEHSGF
jgi:hypothetical protein